jgi:pyruvate formate lyase activating enzyme
MGRDVIVGELMAEARRDAPFFRRSGGGITFSGGEPLSQPGFLLECLRTCRRWGFHTAVETCGQARWEDLREAARVTDLFLYDVKAVDTLLHEELTGVGNEVILENLERLLALGAAVTVRVPLIEGANDAQESLEELAGFVARHPAVRTVELLPCHALGVHKYAALDLTPPRVGRLAQERLVEAVAIVVRRAPAVECRVTHGLV